MTDNDKYKVTKAVKCPGTVLPAAVEILVSDRNNDIAAFPHIRLRNKSLVTFDYPYTLLRSNSASPTRSLDVGNK